MNPLRALQRRRQRKARKQWADALVSGAYPQGREYLHQTTTEGDKFCCLGVACSLAAKSGLVRVTTNSSTFLYNGYQTVLPYSLREWLGITAVQHDLLVQMNDNKRADFETIAATIRGFK